MGIWHHRVVDTQKSYRKENGQISSSFLSNKTKLSPFGELALTSEPYTSHTYYQQKIYIKNTISLVIDGRISNVDKRSNIFEYLIMLYQKYGVDYFYDLEGSFSLLLYDEEKQLTLLFRSFLTGNPLYFVAKNNLLSVSTNPVYLLHRYDVLDILDQQEMNAMFSLAYGELSGNVFSELSSVECGEMVIITPKAVKHTKRSFRETFKAKTYDSESEVIDRYRMILEETVANNILPDVKYGIMLSSGMDSSALAVFAKQQLERENRSLTAYSWTFPNDPCGDESEKIKELCQTLDIPLKLFNGESYGPFDMLKNIYLLPDTPYTNSYWPIVAKTYQNAAADGVDVLLNGGYGDMLFFRRQSFLADIVKDGKFKLFFPEINMLVKQMGFINAMKHSPAIRGLLKEMIPNPVLNGLKYFKPVASVEIPEWLSESATEYRIATLKEDRRFIKDKTFAHLTSALIPYQACYLGWERYLSGQYGIKRMDPYNNFALLNYTSGIPAYMTYRKGQTKYFAREAMRGLLPESIRKQPRAGLLTQFLFDSYERSKKDVRKLLLDDRSEWKIYVNETWMENKLNANISLTGTELIVIRLSLNMQQWQKAIKPRGSLYEGTFTQGCKR